MNAREPGAVLDGKYEIVQRLGSGGMGEVYLVRHVHLQELRVVKILRQDLAADPVAQKRFVREARLATQIKHPNVAILYDFARLPDGSFYMVWEHIQGVDAGDLLRQRGPVPVGAAIRLGIQALRGLGAIHTAGIVHRDVSPDNLMIMENQRQQPWLKIIDLGLAKNLTSEDSSLEITQVGMFMGKLQYCSPEQAGAATGETLDSRTDLYSFALVFYEMITGLPPFESESPHGFIFKRLSEDPLPMIGRNPKVVVPPELDRVVRQALERDRERRLPDAVSFIVALEKVEKGLSKVETREVLMTPGVREAADRRAQGTAPGAQGAGPTSRQRSSSELSRAEKIDLLAQIERAAKRVSESSIDMARAEGALAAGRPDEARRLVAQIEAANPRSPGLDRLKERLSQAGSAHSASSAPALSPTPPSPQSPPAPASQAAAPWVTAAPPPPSPPQLAPLRADEPAAAAVEARSAETAEPLPVVAPAPATQAAQAQEPSAVVPFAESPPAAPAEQPPAAPAEQPPAAPAEDPAADRRRRIGEAETALRRYLERKQLQLARLALDTLLELDPRHPNRGDYESWVNLLAEEVEQDRRAEVALSAGRAAIGRRDFTGAHRELKLVARNDVSGQRADILATELEDAEKSVRQGAEFEERKKRLSELLAARKLPEAEREIELLAGLGLSNITLDSYRERLREARLASDQEKAVAPLEKRYRDLLQARDWFGARDAVQELEHVAPAHPRIAGMHSEIERMEAIHQRQQAVESGVRQVDAFLEKGDLPNAELAFRVLLKLDPDNRHRKRIEKQLRAGRG